MNFEEPPIQKQPDKPEGAKKELEELGFETNQENIEALLTQQETRQHPEGYKEILDNLDNPEELKKAMQERGVTSIVHSEGGNVWEHSKAAIEEIESMDISEEEKQDLKLIMLYHDLGKTESINDEKNKKQTDKNLEKGRLFQTMIGHQKEKTQEIESGFKANGIEGEKLQRFMTVVENHMQTSLLEQDPKKTVKLFQEFGDNEEDIKEVVKLLVNVMQADGNATQRIELEEGDLKYSQNEDKLRLSFDEVWKKYEEGKKIIEKEEEKKKQKEAEEELEKEVFGKKLSEYLMKDKGVESGPNMGKYIGAVKKIMKDSEGMSPEEIRAAVDKKIEEMAGE